MNASKKSPAEQAQAFVAACREHGFTWSASASVVRISKEFTPGDGYAFADCDMVAGDILALAPLKGGSVWGTDGGSVGGHVGLTHGRYELKKSGTGARFLAALNKL